MIPKIIHFCWLSNGAFPEDIAKYMATWRKILPDYQLIHWNFDRFPRGKSNWVDESFGSHKYAFAADYIRCYALYNYGGIYLDCDVEVLKSFDSLLHLPYFMGYENGSGCIEAAIMGSEPGNPILKHILDYFDSHSFVCKDGRLDTTSLPRRMMAAIPECGLKIVEIDSPEDFNFDPKCVSVLPFDYFSPIHLEHKRLESTSRTITIHRFAASWQTGWHNFKERIKRMVGADFTEWFIKTKRKILRKK